MYLLQSAERTRIAPNIDMVLLIFFFAATPKRRLVSLICFLVALFIGLSKKYHCTSVVCGGCGRMIGWQGLWDQGLGILCTLFEGKWVERTTGIYLLIC